MHLDEVEGTDQQMSNDSTTGGPLLPSSPTPAPLTGQAFNRFLQQFVVGVTGLPGDMVRPRWQPEPPNIPEVGDAWASIGVTSRGPSDSYPFVEQIDDDTSQVVRHEEFDVLCSFYDAGSSGLADYYSELLRDGLSVPQNREVLQLADMGLVSVPETSIAVPSLLKEIWLYRVDVEMCIRRRVTRRYPVKSLLSASGVLNTQAVVKTLVTPWRVPNS